jgi:hypothetical protein
LRKLVSVLRLSQHTGIVVFAQITVSNGKDREDKLDLFSSKGEANSDDASTKVEEAINGLNLGNLINKSSEY